ncbi:OmpL47-type beta-barrel domain-containing protein [Bacteroidota bacterium]
MIKSKLLILISLFLLASLSLVAQQQLEHVKRTYISSDGTLFWNRALPVYLWASTSSSESGENILLKSKQTAKYTNPMYWDQEGVHYIRHDWAVDQESKKMVYPQQEVLYEVFADGLAPVSYSKFASVPRFVSGGTIYYGKGLTVTLTSRDAVSGVEKTYNSVNGAGYTVYTTVLNMNEEKAYTLKYYASDNVGNAEEPTTKLFTVDLTSPTSNYSTSQPKVDDILSPKAKITLSFNDNLSGVRNTKYFFDSRSTVMYYSPISLWSLTDGNHTLTYYSTDNVLNEETKKTYTFYLDKTPPVVAQEIVGDQFFGNYKYISSRTTVKLSATDNKAGVDKIFYSIDGRGQNTYGDQFKIPTTDGKHSIAYWGVDRVTNLATKKYLTVFMDNTKPATYISYGKPQFFDRDTLFITSKTPITLTPRDYGSSVLKTEYNVNNGSNTVYSAAYTVSEEGYKVIKFYSIDKVNNVEDTKTSNCFVDDTPPVIYINFSIAPIDKKGGENVYPNYTRMYVAATDKQVGTAEIKYSVNGAPMRLWSSQYTLDASEVPHFSKKNVKYTVKVQAKDKLGNMSEKTVEFYISDK